MTIVAVETNKQRKQFIDFPHQLYANDPNYVPEIYLAQKELFSKSKNPFFKNAKVQLYLAYDSNQRIVGRIAAIRNDSYNDFAKANIGFFGFFDVYEDYEIARQLLDKAVAWVKAEGLDAIQGPTNFSTNDTAGMLSEGFDSPPTVQMTYNAPYYLDFVERYGFQSKMELLSYLITEEKVNMKSLRVANMLEERLKKKGIVVRTLKMKQFKQDVKAIKEVYNAAWDKNWGFVPATDEEFEHLADGLKMIINPDLALIAEHDGRKVGFLLAVPDINEIMRTVKRGRLLPFGIFKLLFGKNKVKKVRIITLGILEDYRKMGIEGIFYSRVIQTCLAAKIYQAEASWVLANNQMMNAGLEKLNAEVYKRHRIYEMPIS
ncbi:MAG: hypothetical protein AAGG75_03780 [Bacteroidota bacterium]